MDFAEVRVKAVYRLEPGREGGPEPIPARESDLARPVLARELRPREGRSARADNLWWYAEDVTAKSAADCENRVKKGRMWEGSVAGRKAEPKKEGGLIENDVRKRDLSEERVDYMADERR